MTSTTKFTSSNATATITTFLGAHFPECTPFVRYGFVSEDGTPSQEFRLRAITHPIPEDATFASALYFLTDSQRHRLERFADNPFGIEGNSNIAKELQGECERADRVLYPVLAESDAGDNGVSIETMAEWLQEFVSAYLDVPAEYCTYFHSGSRSVHVHVPRFIHHGDRDAVKKAAERFCDDTGAELDTGIYKPKQQFRLPGAEHHKTGGHKVQFNPEDGRRGLVEAVKKGVKLPETFTDVLAPIFDPYPSSEGGPFLTVSTPKPTVKTPLIERQTAPTSEVENQRWDAYNRKEFSPYAHARSGNGRSVAALKVVGSPFARREVTDGNGTRPVHALVPVYFYGAHGCNGRAFTKCREYAPLQLSKKDYEKRDYQRGDILILIGGGNGSSIIHEVGTSTAVATGNLLGNDGSRKEALAFLEREGYEVGSSGSAARSRGTPAQRKNLSELDRVLPATNPRTRAGRLQQQVEQQGVHSLANERDDMRRIGNRLLSKYNWELAWEWFKEQYGREFDPEITYRELRSLAEYYNIDVTVPSENPGF